MPKGKPNILVIWGDDIGITNLSCYSDGLMGYRTPNIDRVASEGMRFTDSYGEQSCTAGRASFITGQSVFRTGLSKVGLPGSPVGLQAEDPTIAELLKNHGYATGQFGKNHFGDRTSSSRRCTASTSSSGTCTTSTPRRTRRIRTIRASTGTRGSRSATARAGCSAARRRTRTMPRRNALGPRREAADPGHGPAHEEAYGDLRRRVRRGRRRLHRASAQEASAVLLLGEHHAHALPHAHEAQEPGEGGSLAVALPRHDARP